MRHGASQLTVRRGILRDLDDEIAQLGNIVIIRVLRTGQHCPPCLCGPLRDCDLRKSLSKRVLIQCQIIVAKRFDLCSRKILRGIAHGAEIHRQLCLCDSLASVIYDSKDVFLVDFRCLGLRHDIDGGAHALGVLHAEGAGLGRHVAIEVLEPDGERMCAVAEIYALEIERTVVDLQLAGVVRAVQQHANAARINAGSVFIGELAVGIDGGEAQIAASQHSRTVALEHRTRGGLRDRFQHRSGHVVGIRAVDELEIINVNISRAFFTVLRRSYANSIGAAHINWHLKR